MKNNSIAPILEFIKSNIYIILGGLCIIAVGIVYVVSRSSTGNMHLSDTVVYHATTPTVITTPMATAPEIITPPPETAPVTHIVHIVGEVLNPGVFEIEAGARVADVVALAGGTTPYADLLRINLAAFTQDGIQIIVPTLGEALPLPAQGNASNNALGQGAGTGLVNINTATAAELQTLHNIGAAIASNIIEFREANGRFTSVDELINVPRIGTVTLDRLRDLVTV